MDAELRDLLSAWLGEELPADRRDPLLARLAADEAFRKDFVAEIRMLGMLEAVQAAEPRWLQLEDELGWSLEERANAEGIDDQILFDAVTLPARRRWAKRGLAAAALLLAGIGLAVTFGPRALRRSGPQVSPSAQVAIDDRLAIVVRLDGVRWEPMDRPPPAEGDVLPAARLRLRSGRMTLSMLNGVVIVVEGPADVELASNDKVFCHRGMLRACVPEGAEGFVVNGPGMAVVDLGTEFGLNIGREGKASGKVFKGEVEAAVLGVGGSLRHSQIFKTGGHGFEIDPQIGLIDSSSSPHDFVSSTQIIPPALALHNSYPAAIAASGPWGYWRFESLTDGAVSNEVAGRPPLRAHGTVELGGTAPGGRCAVFRPGVRGQYFALGEEWKPTRKRGFALELWFLAESIRHATLASLVAEKDTKNHVFLMELTSRNRFVLHRPASLRALHRWPPGDSGGDNIFSGRCYVPYRWHHLVAQLRDDQIEMYLDGEITASLPLKIEDASIPCQLLLGELTTLDADDTGASRPFAGRIDEVAAYEHALTVEEIQAHHRLATQAAAGK